MSGESVVHTRLVERLELHVRTSHLPPRGLLILADHHSYDRNRPGRIGGYLPDLYASDLPTTFEIIGEAKTPADLETPRSARQITAFLDHLALRPGSTFYLCVRVFSQGRARALLKRLRGPGHERVDVRVIADV